MIESALVGIAIPYLVRLLGDVLTTPAKRGLPFDFIVESDDDSRIAIEVKGTKITKGMLSDLASKLGDCEDKITGFFLVTTDAPNASQKDV